MSLEAALRLRRGAFALDLALSAPASKTTALFGPSGAGKSLALAAIAGLERIDAGFVALNGRRLADAAARLHLPPHLRRVGLVFQEPRLFPHLTVAQNLAFPVSRGGNTPPAPIAELVRLFDLEELMPRRPARLSGGEKARAALARALMAGPEALLLDEPFAALDGLRRARFLDHLRELGRRFGLLQIVVTHQIDDLAQLADHVVAVSAGGRAASGPLDTLAFDAGFRALLAPRDVGAPMEARAPGETPGRVWLRADHVLLARDEPTGISARNIWPSTVARLDREADGAVLVELASPAGRHLARITSRSAEALGLAEGLQTFSIVKAHAL